MSSVKELARLIHVSMVVPNPLPVFVWGPPGCAKSSVVESVARQTGRESSVFIGAIHDPTDLSGVPFKGDGGKFTSHLPPEFLWRAANTEGNFVLIMDEVTSSSPAMQAAMMRLVLERKTGCVELPDNVRLVLIGNPPDVAANGSDLADPLSNRVLHYQYDGPTLDEWSMFEGGVDTVSEIEFPKLDMDRYRAELSKITGQMSGYFKKLGNVQFENPDAARGRFPMAYATHRSWSSFCRYAAAALAMGMDDLVLKIGIGLVGEGHATQFEAARRTMDFPLPSDLVDGKVQWEPNPERPDITFAVARAVALESTSGAVTDKRYKDRWIGAWRILDKVAEQGDDFIVVAMRILVREGKRPKGWNDDPVVAKTAARLSWIMVGK